ncbi:MAG: DnaB-like helicase C-terminal domain-containing protein [Endomicrobiaceae bacterium]|nr:DnaB-like helicase C-terminal domain-containing protein [Endomicrobiaceae bacterium]
MKNLTNDNRYPIIKDLIQPAIVDLEIRHSSIDELRPMKELVEKIDYLQKIKQTDLVVISGGRLAENTETASWIVLNTLFLKNKAVLYLSLVIHKNDLINMFLCLDAGLNYEYIKKGFFTESDWGKIIKSAHKLSEKLLYVCDLQLSEITIIEQIEKLHKEISMKKQNLSLVIIDYFQLIKCKEFSKQKISEILKLLKQSAINLKITIVLLWQFDYNFSKNPDEFIIPKFEDIQEFDIIKKNTDFIGLIEPYENIFKVYKPDMKKISF